MGEGRKGSGAVLAAWSLWALAVLTLVVIAVLDGRLRAAGRADLAVLVPLNLPPLLAAVSAATVGAVVAGRRPRHPSGWLLLAFGLSLAVAGVGMASVNAAVAGTGLLPGGDRFGPYLPVLIVVAVACNAFLLLLTPAGSLPSRRWRWWAAVTAVTPAALVLVVTVAPGVEGPPQPVASPLDLRALGGAAAVAFQAAFSICQLANVAAAVSLVARFRRAGGVERQQLRWIALGTGVVVFLSLIVVIAVAANAFILAGLIGGLCPTVISAASGAAVLRYRLYDLDRLISRTLSYGLLTVLMGGCYALVVLGIGQWLAPESSVVVAGATLALAAAFRPALGRIQTAVDRRFNRRYDGARTVEAFNARMRHQVDLDTLTAHLLGVVEQSVQPASVSLWLRQSGLRSSQPAGSTAGWRPVRSTG